MEQIHVTRPYMFFKEPKTAAECLDYYRICEEQAQMAASADVRSTMIECATQWREMAKRLARERENETGSSPMDTA